MGIYGVCGGRGGGAYTEHVYVVILLWIKLGTFTLEKDKS
jgi:hypothetical protein